ncbi:phosphotransferase [Dyella caseinilytica]|uniref:Phosphotransferase n=1 Tax=Dyella caseinilytica TaxID=1849581 RepID=A0ABX7GSX1_9GAMM|nr:phosphotransferase [Dyella caseinilytica]QRN53481.1 phosphotransferase [Dyella caseinilytica]GFZ86826.1 phosphotransferase [Dyella caseinilytica]
MSVQMHWSELIPHAGAMRLLDHVMDWDDRHIHVIAERHRPGHHPLQNGMHLHAVHLTEYGAQASAVHGALLASARGEACVRAGRLVSLRDVQLAIEYVDLAGGHLDVHAECLLADERGAQYLFKVEQRGLALASGRVAVIYTAQ